MAEHQASTEGVSLLTDETVLANVHPSWVNWKWSLIIALLVLLIGLGSGSSDGIIGGILVAAIIVAYVYYSRKVSRYVVTDQRVIKRVGLLSKSTGETRISDIRSLTTNTGILEGLIGKGSVQIDSTGAGGHLGIEGVGNYEQLANTIREQQREVEAAQ